MAKYLKEFQTTSQYNAYTADTANFILPNVSVVKDDLGTVHYNPLVDPYAGHEYVEIGGLKWATMNIGANSVTDEGLHFQWGDTQGYTASQVGSGEGQKYFGWTDYKYWTADTGSGSSGMTKYNDETINDFGTLDASDDAATVAWGGNWRTPTYAEYQTLHSATTLNWVADYQGSGINGMVFTDKNDSSKTLFFPATQYFKDGTISNSNYYMTSSTFLAPNFTKGFVRISYYSEDSSFGYGLEGPRYYGIIVRAVAD